MFDTKFLLVVVIVFVCIFALVMVFNAGLTVAELVTYDVEAKYTVEAEVTKVDAQIGDSGAYIYKVYAVDTNGKVFTDSITEEQYAIINVGDIAVFDVVEASTCLGNRTSCNYVS